MIAQWIARCVMGVRLAMISSANMMQCGVREMDMVNRTHHRSFERQVSFEMDGKANILMASHS